MKPTFCIPLQPPLPAASLFANNSDVLSFDISIIGLESGPTLQSPLQTPLQAAPCFALHPAPCLYHLTSPFMALKQIIWPHPSQ